MAIDLFRVRRGVEIKNDVTGEKADVIVGDGIPGSNAAQIAAPIGTVYLRTNTETDGLQIYWKFTLANSSSADWKQSVDKSYVDTIASGLSWREPVVAMDTTLYANAAAFPTGGTIDGVGLSVNDRVLFSNVTASTDENIFIWDGSAWTEDTNQESSGDAVLVMGGTNSNQKWVYDGTNWYMYDSGSDSVELGYIRDYIGKTGPGAEAPTYSSTNIITQTDNLETAIGDLDAAIGDHVYTNDNVVTDGETTTASIDALDTALGNQTYTNDNVVTDGETTTASIDALDTAIGNITSQTNTFFANNVVAVAGVTMDTLALSDATEAKWIIQIRETGTPANRRSLEVHAMNDGSTLVDHTEYAELELGSDIAGLDIDVTISGTDMLLRVTATNNIDYVVRRVAFTAF